jgi:hypothetical protein
MAALSKKQPRRHERVVMGAGHHRVGGRDRAADAAHHRFPGARRHRGIAVDIGDAARRRDVPELLDVMFVVAERDQIEVADRRFAALQPRVALPRQHLIDRAQPVGALGVSRRCLVAEKGGVGKKKRHALSVAREGALSRDP